jgi:hypothetical protein
MYMDSSARMPAVMISPRRMAASSRAPSFEQAHSPVVVHGAVVLSGFGWGGLAC